MQYCQKSHTLTPERQIVIKTKSATIDSVRLTAFPARLLKYPTHPTQVSVYEVH